jgi:hypothetical protein
MDAIISEYLRFNISRKEIKNGYKSRKPQDFYRHLRQNATLYNVSIFDILKRDAYFVIKGEYIKLSDNNHKTI